LLLPSVCCPTADAQRSNVFLGLALEKQNENEASEKAYDAAAKLKPAEALAWQGLVTLYEKQAGKKIDEYAAAALRLAEYFMNVYVS
jgi:superkiller protein 3